MVNQLTKWETEMPNFVMPLFSGQKLKEDNYLQLLSALGLLSKEFPGESKRLAEKTFDKLVPKVIIDGEECSINEQTRAVALFFYAQFKETGQPCFRMTKEIRKNFIDYLSRDFAWEVFIHQGRYPLIERMLSKNADIEVVTQQLVGA